MTLAGTDTVVTMNQKEQIGKAIGRIASGVYIVTVEYDGIRDGMMASWISQAAFEPPMLSVAIKQDRQILQQVQVGKKFSVNVLSKKNMDIFKSFVKPWESGLDRYQGLNVLPEVKAGPVLADAVAYLDCVSKSVVEAGDHFVVLAEITGGGPLQLDNEPMVHFRSNGFQY